MTIGTMTSTVTYQGNGSTTVFTFPFVGDSPADLVVTYTNTLGVSVVLSPSLYTVTINAIPVGGLWGIGGSVTYPNTGSPPVPIQTGTQLSITRDVPYEQTVSINNQGAFYPAVIEQGLDILELQIQQINTGLEYTLQFPVTDPDLPNVLPSYTLRAGGILGFDSNGQPIISTLPTVTPTPGSFATPRKVSTTGTSTIPILTTDSFGGVSIYQSGSPVTTLQLPSGAGPYPIFDGSLNANAFPVTILPPAGKTILGQTSYALAFAGQAVTMYLDGTQVLIG